ncbi:MAG: hypothetical protein HOM43_00345 [Flavobacteriales bacterium]|nr:hypothetical protein [Flavobacteriales bacterium]MDA7721730.1 hypothetical protein [Schleiferiaceae bacterium]MDB2626911.1 hypothetical protein [Schleiferiaceae bacterium]MDC0376176.1 hypothetical protein [Schleiferiaceae bacterium]
MKNFVKITGSVGAGALVGSSIFKLLHWMGAPELLLIGTVSTGLFIIGFTIQKLSKK